MAMIPIQQSGRSLQKNRAQAIENILTFTGLSENEDLRWEYLELPGVAKVIADFNRVPLTTYSGFDCTFLYESLGQMTSYDRLFVAADSQEGRNDLAELDAKWEYSSAAFFDNHEELCRGRKGYLFSITGTRWVPLKAVRGLFPLRSSNVYENYICNVFSDGKYTVERDYIQYFGNAWHRVGVPIAYGPERLDEILQTKVWMDRSIAFTREYDWSVEIGLNVTSTPALSLQIDPKSSRDVFKMRDLTPGKSRRDALRHWVSGHHRKAIEPGYVETYIWPYLRGAEEFTWNGMYCKIKPSEYDLRKAKEYQLMRKGTVHERA